MNITHLKEQTILFNINSSVKEILDFYQSSNNNELVNEADAVCRKYHGDSVYVRGLIEFSNYCIMDCLYCGIRKSNEAVNRYRMDISDITSCVNEGVKKGFNSFVLQSGEDDYFDVKKITFLIEDIRKKVGDDVAITLSCGVFTKDQYRDMKNAGADRYLLRFETSDTGLHEYLRNGISFERRLKALYDLKELGFETGSGFMTGLPGETEEIRIQNALLCKELELDMIGIGPFIPHQNTPLADSKKEPLELTLKMTALVRLLLPESNIPATTATGTIDPKGRELALCAGANVVMVNITPVEFKKDYILYPDKICIDEDGMKCLGCIAERILGAEKRLDMTRGNSISWEKNNA